MGGIVGESMKLAQSADPEKPSIFERSPLRPEWAAQRPLKPTVLMWALLERKNCTCIQRIQKPLMFHGPRNAATMPLAVYWVWYCYKQ